MLSKLSTLALSVASLGVLDTAFAKSSSSSPADILQFDNVGYLGYYYPVTKIEALSDGNCSCEKDMENPFVFSGPLAPLDEELTVHLRGPLNLRKFGYYVTDSYSFGSSSGSWERKAYYDSEQGTANNVTFLANYGNKNACLGNATDYVTPDGLKLANDSQVLDNTTIPSGYEVTIASDIKCQGEDDCGAYRTDGQAYHGFYGLNKMFLFEFWAPSDMSEEHKKNKTDGYDMPAIWLLNAHIPRTSQYPMNPNCSSWNTGAGEFDIFEVMNYTERNNFYSTIHDFQGTDDIGTGLQNFGYLERTPESVMTGGVIFAEDKTITVFLSNSISIDSTINNSDLSNWVSALEKETEDIRTLSSISQAPPSLTTTGKSTKTKSSESTSSAKVSSVSSSSHKNGADVLSAAPSSLMATLTYVVFSLFYI